MMNENTFTKNFRGAFASQSPRLLTPEEQTTSTFQKVVPTFQKFPEKPADYGSQQNAAGLTAISVLLGGMGFAPEAILGFLAAGSEAKRNFSSSDRKQPEENFDNGIIDKDPSPSNLFNNLKPISPNSSREEILKTIEENNKILERTRSALRRGRR